MAGCGEVRVTKRMGVSVPAAPWERAARPEAKAKAETRHQAQARIRKERRARVAELFEQGLSSKEMQAALGGPSSTTLQSDMAALGLRFGDRDGLPEARNNRREEIARLHGLGWPSGKIADEIGVSHTAVGKTLASLGLKANSATLWRREHVAQAIDAGLELHEIAEALGVSYETVRRDREALGTKAKK